VSARTVHRLPAPPELLAHSTLARVDHADTYAVEVPGDGASAEALARAILEDAPLRRRAPLLAGWTALGLALDVGDPEAVLGWRIRRSTGDLLLLGADGRIGLSGELLFEHAGGRLRFATFVQLDGRPARLAWAGIERTHDAVVRMLLAEGVSRRAGGSVSATARV
jgi:hypothetical protein